MSTDNGPTYAEWVDYVFSGQENQDDFENNQQFLVLDKPLLAGYLTQLFRSNWSDLSLSLSRDELAKGIWFIFGHGSEYLFDVRDESVPQHMQREVIAALGTTYTNTFDRLGDQGRTRKPQSTNDFDNLDGAIYMIWDMDCIEIPAMSPGHEHLVDPIFAVLDRAISCQTVTCQISGLHGLGHLADDQPNRVHPLIDRFLASKRAALPWVAEYAKQARTGRIQ